MTSRTYNADPLTGDDDDARVAVFEGRAFHGIRELGFNERGAFVLGFHTTPAPMPRGGYFTALAISPASYRKSHPTKCCFVDEGRQVVVYDDWGRMHRIAASRDVLDALIRNMQANNLPVRVMETAK
jgi:hypothetical protein